MADDIAPDKPVALHPITKKPWTDEDRKAQSDRAKAQVARGEIGGAVAGRRKRKPAYAVIAAMAQRHAREIGQELVEQALNAETPSQRLAAIKVLMDIEQKAKQERRDDEEHLIKLSPEELQAAVLARLNDLGIDTDYDVDLDEDDVEDFDGDG